MSHSILVRRNEEYASIDLKVRGLFNLGRQSPLVVTFQLPQWMLEPDGETCPPHTMRTNADVDMLLSVHEWNTEPKLCIVSGPQEVAKYHYLCRSPFDIGRFSFLQEGVTEEQHLAMINDIMSRGRLTCSEEVINEFNDPEKLMLMHRFSLEVDKATNSLDLNVGVDPGMGDHIVPIAPTQPVVNQPIQDTNPFGILEDNARISPVSVLRTAYDPSTYSGISGGYVSYDQARYWAMRDSYYESLMASSYALQLGRIYGVPGSEFTGYVPSDLNIVNSGEQEIPQYQAQVDVSSTASSTEFNTGLQLGGQINNSTLGNGRGHGQVISEIGEPSRRVFGEVNIKQEVKDETEVTTQGGQRNADDAVEGTPGEKAGGI
ncbi:Uncharacterized protein Rs2_18608 [Raphanus sativus]|nr:Uncharacterized protein Rs2_18608 [Raphanus sativus]